MQPGVYASLSLVHDMGAASCVHAHITLGLIIESDIDYNIIEKCAESIQDKFCNLLLL